MTEFSDPGVSAEHEAFLVAHAVSPEMIKSLGIYSISEVAGLPPGFEWAGERAVPALCFPWRTPGGEVVPQLRPDVPVAVEGEERPRKYLWPKGSGSVLGTVRAGDGPDVMFAEGTKQSAAAASWWPGAGAVYALAGCRAWSSEGVPVGDLHVAEGKRCYVALDADMETNPEVWMAAKRFGVALRAEGAAEVRYVLVPGGAKAGLDDVLAKRPADRRSDYLARLLEQASVKLPARPKAKRPEPGDGEYFGEGGLLVRKLAADIYRDTPSALTAEGKVALYDAGAYRLDRHGETFKGAVARRLDEDYRPAHRVAVEEFTQGTLHNSGRRLPERAARPLLNVANGMLDLATGELLDHDPSYLSSVQFPVTWDSTAAAPAYEAWAEAIGIADQLDGLEETVAAMLDPSRTPPKAVFLFGASRSGKSTFLRLMTAVAGKANTSAVSLHQLADNRFMAANVYGKALNACADLSSGHVEDMALFKMMTGEDRITADRKSGSIFDFTNRALFAFSANELPTVGEGSRAYVERIRPVWFRRSFAGSEDPGVEDKLLSELPGILVRWVEAWQRRANRGRALPLAVDVSAEFETRSDRVRQWVSEQCVVVSEAPTGAGGELVAVMPGAVLPPAFATGPRALAKAFNAWAVENGGSRMGERKVIDRLTSMDGVLEVRSAPAKGRALNIITAEEGGSSGTFNPTSLEIEKECQETVDKGVDTHFPVHEQSVVESATTATDPLTSLLSSVPDLPPSLCPDCDSPLQPTPPALFWSACPRCTPGSFPAEA